MSKPNRVVVRTYCEMQCDCPNCHQNNGNHVEDCVYCQLKWAGKGEYNPKWRKEHALPPVEETLAVSTLKSDEEVLQEIIKWWKEQ